MEFYSVIVDGCQAQVVKDYISLNEVNWELDKGPDQDLVGLWLELLDRQWIVEGVNSEKNRFFIYSEDANVRHAVIEKSEVNSLTLFKLDIFWATLTLVFLVSAFVANSNSYISFFEVFA